MTKRFTGRHMAFILVLFFGVVMAVNFNMARLAIGNFGGTVVDNSYVASQHYDEWRDAQAEQDALGWDASATIEESGHVRIDLEGFSAMTLEGRAEHPFQKSRDEALTFARQPDGSYLSDAPLSPGRWELRLEAETAERTARFLIPVVS
ncbi:FixH family protein [Sphingomicrobium sediminis]|uniref:FixH family protein n=1 Tax=Sphingomicrobium sediminis TaxID=2950949 RepID=A0A9X2EIM6_9SPHN|nr:FixH family protein [Sphingomicrobium sediminis]MCM8558217.1 FixH family protein [Sphingomicrobium sediminis]